MEHNTIFDIIRKPIFTEKSNNLKDKEQKILIEVAPWANKNQIGLAVKAMFDINVLAVNTLKYRGKKKRVRQQAGRQRNFKRAYLTLERGTDVDLFGAIGQNLPEEAEKQPQE